MNATNGTRGRTDGLLKVQCWCRTDEVLVDPKVVKAGRTRSCGRPGCRAPKGGAA